ncbi:rhox homeobox family member 1 isoform X1 [Octodon degus]|uniref:Rhox homeobox family member 1 isoform X1 n=1 Tax=Octodon degus TaxID=10160 RepID=A0A6P6DPA8_OCTDE|nr:rhox homeobox family member 1 isoform X1 [Octodon degus]
MEEERYPHGLLSLNLELWQLEASAGPAQGVPAAAEVRLFTEGIPGIGADGQSEAILEEDGGETLNLGVNMRHGIAPIHHEENHVDQQPEQLSQAQQDTADARGRRRGRPRRQRMQFSFMRWQVQEMESVFQETQYPDVLTRSLTVEHLLFSLHRWKLARDLNVPESRVQVWFNNRRAKYRKNQRKALLRNVPPDSLDRILMDAEAELF